MWSLIENNQTLLVSFGVVSFLVFVVTILLTPWLVGLIPADYLVNSKYGHSKIKGLKGVFLFLIRNVFGLFFLLLGIIMLFTPGQGIITILLALILMQFPGKYQLILKLINRPGVLSVLNWLRAKNNKSNLELSK